MHNHMAQRAKHFQASRMVIVFHLFNFSEICRVEMIIQPSESIYFSACQTNLVTYSSICEFHKNTLWFKKFLQHLHAYVQKTYVNFNNIYRKYIMNLT